MTITTRPVMTITARLVMTVTTRLVMTITARLVVRTGDIDAVDRCRRQRRHGPHQIVVRAQQRQHRPVVVRVRRHVEHPYAARRSGLHTGVDDVPPPPLADVRNALQANHAFRLARQPDRDYTDPLLLGARVF